MTMPLPPFQHLVDAHWRDVARLAAALAGVQEGDDVAQQAWTQALAAYPSLDHTRNLRSWLFTITSRAAVDAHRRRTRSPIPTEEVPDGPTIPAGLHDAALWNHVRALPERQRLAVALHYVMDLPHAEIAKTLGTTPAATRRLVSDALKVLRHALATEDAAATIKVTT